MAVAHALCRLIRALGRYFFVKAPSRTESRVEVASATARVVLAVNRLDMELERFDGALRNTVKGAEQ